MPSLYAGSSKSVTLPTTKASKTTAGTELPPGIVGGCGGGGLGGDGGGGFGDGGGGLGFGGKGTAADAMTS